MKRLIIIAAVASVMASCAVTKTRTARTADISSEITQMPTVVELDVADKREKSDVFEWANRMFSFKRRIGVKEKTQEAVAQILERTDADVLIEPKVSVDRRIKPFATDYTLSVSGYPAKYKAFRTATVEDIETVNALRKPAEHRTIRIADYMRPQTAHLSRQTRNTVAIANAVTKKPRWESARAVTWEWSMRDLFSAASTVRRTVCTSPPRTVRWSLTDSSSVWDWGINSFRNLCAEIRLIISDMAAITVRRT